MAGKRKKGQPQGPVNPMQAERAPMPSLKVKKQKKTSRGK